REPARGSGGREARRTQLVAVEGGTFEQVAELFAIGRVIERKLLGPRPAFDLRLEHRARIRSRPPPLGPSGSRAAPRAPRPGARAGRPCARGSARTSRLPVRNRGRA